MEESNDRVKELTKTLKSICEGSTEIAGCLREVERPALTNVDGLRLILRFAVRKSKSASISIYEEDGHIRVELGDLEAGVNGSSVDDNMIAERGYEAIERTLLEKANSSHDIGNHATDYIIPIP